MPPLATAGRGSFAAGTRLFVKVLALSHLAAFVSYWLQADGLIGPKGVLPAREFLEAARQQIGPAAWLEAPSLCWIFGAGASIAVLCAVGIAASVLLLLDLAPAACLGVLWICYLSLVSVGQIFFDFQWDGLLLESTLIAVFLVPWRLRPGPGPHDPPRLARLLSWWLLFRLMFLSGVVKLTSGDPTWRHLDALTFHYETQPLPTAIAWYASHLPRWFHVGCCLFMFAVELGAPLCLAATRRVRHGAALAMIALQVAIALTGNYAYFNLLTIGLCLTCLDDDWWRYIHWGVGTPQPATDPKAPRARVFAGALRWFAALSVGVTFFESAAAVTPRAAHSPIVRWVADTVGPFRSFNDYGLFAIMTVERPELVFQGSDDGRDWRDYVLPYKPGDPGRRPRWAAPYQPRLDWQLWFAALGPADSNPWVQTVCERLLRGDAAVAGLFSVNPFRDHPPRYLRVVRYRYQFTDARVRSLTGNWWRRSPIDFYVEPVTLPPKAP